MPDYITCQDEKGVIHISEDVVLAMVRAAVSEVDGVAGLASSAGTELADLFGLKSASKGVKVQIVVLMPRASLMNFSWVAPILPWCPMTKARI